MSETERLFQQSSHYFIGQFLVMAAGFISFPILTRIFSISDYGILYLLNTTMFIFLTVSRLGLAHTVVRFYSEFKSKNELPSFHSTIFIGYAILALTIVIIFLLTVQLFSERFLNRYTQNLLSLISIIVFSSCLTSIFTSSNILIASYFSWTLSQ